MQTAARQDGPLVDHQAPPRPGFVIYTDAETIVVPDGGSGPVFSPGLWIQDDGHPEPKFVHHSLVTPGHDGYGPLPACPFARAPGACTLGTHRETDLDPQTGLHVELPEACACWTHEENLMDPPPPEDVDGERYEPCAWEGEMAPVALVGGALQWVGWDWNGACFGGLSVYDSASIESALTDEPAELDEIDGFRRWGCTHDHGPAEVVPTWPLPRSVYGRDDDFCDWAWMNEYSGPEAQSHVLRRGHLWRIQETVGHAGGTRWISRRAVSPQSCPTAADPCGDPEAFSASMPSDADFDLRHEFWISTDGRAALTASGFEYRSWHVGDGTPIHFALPDIDAAEDVIGIRRHDDVGRLIAVIDSFDDFRRGLHAPRVPTFETCEAPPTYWDDAERLAGRSARAWGNRCYEHLTESRWTAAEAACRRGLEIADDPTVEGSLWFNLARIAEARGASTEAIRLYTRSLELRPDNRATARKLARIRIDED